MTSATPRETLKGSTLICSLVVRTGNIPSFKNWKRAGVNKSTGKPMTFTDPDVKSRMQELEDGIFYALCSWCQSASGATDSECRKQLRTLLSGLSDDSLNQVPEFSYGVSYVSKGQEGVAIVIAAFDGETGDSPAGSDRQES